jgi:hypothetical protein
VLREEPQDLARAQRGLQALLYAPGERTHVDAAGARAIGCNPEEVGVYRGMIALRFAREVAREFPATRALLGGARFDAAARAFAERTPSHSYTLDGYARRFPEHLHRGGDAALRAGAELARLEREISRMRVAKLRRARAGMNARNELPQLWAAPGARLRRFGFDVESALAAHERNETPAALAHGEIRLALFRRAGRVARLRVARAEAPMLAALLRGDSLERAVARGVAAGLAPAAIRDALARWVAARLLYAGGAPELF